MSSWLSSVATLSAAALAVLGSSSLAGESSADGRVFTEGAAESGIVFRHFNGMSGEFYFPEMTGQGGALFDYDGDGDLDVYLVQGALLGSGKSLSDALEPPAAGSPAGDRLYRNDSSFSSAGDGLLRFVDVTEASRILATGYGMGVAIGDIDGDDDLDLYVTNYGPNQLWINSGDGTFLDGTEEAGVGDPSWSTSAAFSDLDGDGLPDLYVVNYVEFDLERNPRCFAPSSRRDYCGPSGFEPQADRLFRNLGARHFEDVTLRALPGYRSGPGLGVVASDLNGDSLPDIYVANDGEPNQLWLNRGGGRFSDEALLSGAAVNRQGLAEASMGVALGDYDGDGDEDLFLTHLAGETNTLFVNDGSGLFDDRTTRSGLGSASLPYTAFGTDWLDVDNDGDLDLLIVNGGVRIDEELAAAGDPYPLRQPNQLFRNRGGAGFEEIGDLAWPEPAREEVSRGLAVGDIDNDGDTDALELNNNGPARLLFNDVGSSSPWIGVRPAPFDALEVGLRFEDGRTLWRRSRRDGSYCSSRDPRPLFGLGNSGAPSAIEIVRPDGSRLRLNDPAFVRRYLSVPSRAEVAPPG